MTFPSGGKTHGDQWVAEADFERDVIGSNDQLRVGDFCVLQDDGSRHRCTSVDGPDSSTWVATLPGGDVVSGPGGAVVDNTLVRWDGVTGTAVQGSGVTCDDSDNVGIPGRLTVNIIALDTDAILRGVSASTINVRNLADTDYRDLQARTILIRSLIRGAVDGASDSGTSAIRWGVVFADEVNPSRVVEGGGTDHIIGDYSLAEGGFGATASVALVGTPNDLRGIVDITAAGAGQDADPTVVLTFADGAFAVAPVVLASRGDLSGAPGEWRVTAQTTTSVTFTFNGTPVAAQVYRLLYQIVG